jgi:hypothetical protein
LPRCYICFNIAWQTSSSPNGPPVPKDLTQ